MAVMRQLRPALQIGVRADQVQTQRIAWRSRGRIARGKITILDGDPGLGKAVALDTPVPTPVGWTTMGALRVGDSVFDERGEPCRIVAVSDVQIGRPCYRVGFSDGSCVIADAEHLWQTTDRVNRHREAKRRWKRRQDVTDRRNRGPRPDRVVDGPAVRTTREIAETLTVADGRANHAIPATLGLALPDAPLPVPAYTLGAWLGDGTTDAAILTCFDPEIVARIEADGYRVTEQATRGRFTIRGLAADLRLAGVLGAKHIPSRYLRAGYAQRLALLTGLLDTDGYCMTTGTVEFTSTNARLADGVVELARTLGWLPRMSVSRARLNGRDVGPKYRVVFTPDRPVFTIGRKADRQGQPRRATHGLRYVVCCEPVASVPVRCIQVDSPSRLYLVGQGMIPTHNSTLLMDWAARVSRGDPLPDGDPQDERGVLLICAEDDPADTIVPRLKVAGAALEQITILAELPITNEAGDIIDPDQRRLVSLPLDVPLIEQAIVALDIGLVVIDPLMAFLDPELRANSDQDIRTALTPLAAALQRTNASAILVRHLNKSASANALYRGGGSIGIIGIARFGLMVARARDDRDARVLASTKGNLGPPPASLGYRLEGVDGEDVARVVWTGIVHDSADDLLGDTLASDEQKDAQTAAEEFVRQYLGGGPASRHSIVSDAKKVGLSVRSIDRAKQRLGIQHTRVGAHLGPSEAIWVWHLPGQIVTDSLEKR